MDAAQIREGAVVVDLNGGCWCERGEKMDEDEGGSRWSKWCEVGCWSRCGGGIAVAGCVAVFGVVVLL